MKGRPDMSLGPISSKERVFIFISRAGTWTTLSIFIRDASMVAMFSF